MTEQDGFRLEAAEQFGFSQAEDDGPYTCTEAQLIAFAKAAERKGRAEAIALLEQTPVGPAVLRILRERNAASDAELAPIMAAEEERYMTARGYVRGTDEPGKRWVKPDCDVCGGDCAAANPPVLNCPLQSPLAKPDKNFWCIVALDYDKDEAWILDQSQDARDCDLLDGSSGDDNGLMRQNWVKDAVPGLYRLTLRPWSHQSYEGEWDGGVDVDSVTLLVAFPPRLCDDEGCPQHGTDHVCVPCDGKAGSQWLAEREPCEYCGPGKSTGLPGNACENCMNTGLKNPTAESQP